MNVDMHMVTGTKYPDAIMIKISLNNFSGGGGISCAIGGDEIFFLSSGDKLRPVVCGGALSLS